VGHIRLGRLPRTRKWDQVVSLLLADRSSVEIAAASAAAAESALRKAHADSAFGYAFWLLTQIPLAARSPNFISSLQKLGLRTESEPTMLAVLGAFTEAVDRRIKEVGGRTDFGEMAQLAAADSLLALAGRDLPSLFSPTPNDVKLALGRLAAPNRFAMLAREFFSRLTARYLDYFLSREISNHVGPARRLRSIDDHTGFNEALEQHCREVSRIVETFAGGWFSKTHFEGGITPDKAQDFAYVAFKKIQSELRKRSEGDA
jgi:hypothetical protein